MSYKHVVAPFAMALGLLACHHGHPASSAGMIRDRAVWVDPDSSCSDSSPRWLPPNRVSDTLTFGAVAQRRDQLWAWWARRVPGGWGGGPYYLPPRASAPTILLRDPSQKVAALAALDTLMPVDPRFVTVSRDTVVALRARWDLAELYDWMQFIQTNFHTAQGTGINGWGILAQKNRLTITIENAATLPIVVRWLQGLAIPCRLVAVEAVGRNIALARRR